MVPPAPRPRAIRPSHGASRAAPLRTRLTPGDAGRGDVSRLGVVASVEIEERVDAREQLLLDLHPRAVEHVQRHPPLLAAREADLARGEHVHLAGRKEPHAVDEGVLPGAAADELQPGHAWFISTSGGAFHPVTRRRWWKSGAPSRVWKLLPSVRVNQNGGPARMLTADAVTAETLARERALRAAVLIDAIRCLVGAGGGRERRSRH